MSGARPEHWSPIAKHVTETANASDASVHAHNALLREHDVEYPLDGLLLSFDVEKGPRAIELALVELEALVLQAHREPANRESAEWSPASIARRGEADSSLMKRARPMARSWLRYGEMKNLLLLAIGAAAAFYAYTSWVPSARDSGSAGASGESYGSNPVREIQRAPNALIDMQGAMGNANAGAANAARRAATDGLER